MGDTLSVKEIVVDVPTVIVVPGLMVVGIEVGSVEASRCLKMSEYISAKRLSPDRYHPKF